MKTLTIKTIIIFIIFNAFSYSIFAKGVHYSIQISDSISEEKLTSFSPIKYKNKIIEVGEYKDYLFAMKAKYDLKELGLVALEIKAYFNYEPITIQDSFTLLNNRNSQDQKTGGQVLTAQEMEIMLDQVSSNQFFYTVQLAVESDASVNSFFDFPKTIDERISSKGHFRYTYGEFKTLQDAKDALRMVKEYGLEEAFITAYDDLERIPLARAIEKEQKMLLDALAQNK